MFDAPNPQAYLSQTTGLSDKHAETALSLPWLPFVVLMLAENKDFKLAAVEVAHHDDLPIATITVAQQNNGSKGAAAHITITGAWAFFTSPASQTRPKKKRCSVVDALAAFTPVFDVAKACAATLVEAQKHLIIPFYPWALCALHTIKKFPVAIEGVDLPTYGWDPKIDFHLRPTKPLIINHNKYYPPSNFTIRPRGAAYFDTTQSSFDLARGPAENFYGPIFEKIKEREAAVLPAYRPMPDITFNP